MFSVLSLFYMGTLAGACRNGYTNLAIKSQSRFFLCALLIWSPLRNGMYFVLYLISWSFCKFLKYSTFINHVAEAHSLYLWAYINTCWLAFGSSWNICFGSLKNLWITIGLFICFVSVLGALTCAACSERSVVGSRTPDQQKLLLLFQGSLRTWLQDPRVHQDCWRWASQESLPGLLGMSSLLLQLACKWPFSPKGKLHTFLPCLAWYTYMLINYLLHISYKELYGAEAGIPSGIICLPLALLAIICLPFLRCALHAQKKIDLRSLSYLRNSYLGILSSSPRRRREKIQSQQDDFGIARANFEKTAGSKIGGLVLRVFISAKAENFGQLIFIFSMPMKTSEPSKTENLKQWITS